ncbi:MAG: MBL fold metallo-hydrolase [Ignavibacteriales bacterium]|nr:MBL fold metallo-hydrolase [Ignavibacteriales bacterium]
MKIQFIGAARSVTGSMHLLHINGSKILLDCGMVQGKRKESFEANRNFIDFDPREIDLVILSHAHIDHAGNLPSLVRKGFRGPIYSTFATKDLCSLMLQDCAHIQEHDLEFVNKKRKRAKKNLFEPLYTQEDVIQTLKQFIGVNYHNEVDITPEVRLTFYDAGHILGSSIVHLMIQEKERVFSFAFSGDLGRPNLPILRDPEKIPDVDYFLCESTYGGRFHDSFTLSGDKMAEVIKKAVNRKAKIIVPSFSVGRTQELVYLLNELFEQDKAPRIPIYVDSPLSVNVTQVFRLHPECFDFETSRFILRHKDPFGFAQLQYITNVEDSKELNSVHGPCMIISSSGMAEAGRIVHHLANNIENSNSMILIVGYCAENTLGKKIVEKVTPLNILGESFNLKAEVVLFNSLSAHADSNELLHYCNTLDKEKLKNMFLVHGDFDQQEKFKTRLVESGFKIVTIPQKGEIYEL